MVKDLGVPVIVVQSGDNSHSINEFADKHDGNGVPTFTLNSNDSGFEMDIDGLEGLNLGAKTDDNVEVSHSLLDLFVEENGQFAVHKILSHLRRAGIRPFSDIRLTEMMNKLSIDPQGLTIASEIGVKKFVSVPEFQEASQSCALLLNQALSSNLIIPDFTAFSREIKAIYEDLKCITGGQNAQYIPQLARINPNFLGISVCTIDGQRYSIGDTEIPFCIQSCSKALNYAINVAEHGPALVHRHLGKEPSGVGFNQIRLDKNGLPHNPMINPGAISCCSVIKTGECLADRFDYIIKEYKKMAGEEFIGFSNATFLSEKATADRNFAIGYYLKEHGVFPEGTNLEETLDLYFQLCSVEATADSAAVIAATLANGGECPTSKEICVTPDAVRNTLSLMYSCGMYDYSGEWSFEVGLPAKSGVAGSIFIVVPDVMGICVWSPPLDKLGNSFRGIEFAKRLIKRFSFHQFDTLMTGTSAKIDPRRHVKHETRETIIQQMLVAALHNDMVLLTRYIETGVDFNMADYDDRSALHLAVCGGHLPVVKFLIEKGKANINVLDRWNSTPLDEAYKYEFHDIVKYIERKRGMRGEGVLLAATQQY